MINIKPQPNAFHLSHDFLTNDITVTVTLPPIQFVINHARIQTLNQRGFEHETVRMYQQAVQQLVHEQVQQQLDVAKANYAATKQERETQAFDPCI